MRRLSKLLLEIGYSAIEMDHHHSATPANSAACILLCPTHGPFLGPFYYNSNMYGGLTSMLSLSYRNFLLSSFPHTLYSDTSHFGREGPWYTFQPQSTPSVARDSHFSTPIQAKILV